MTFLELQIYLLLNILNHLSFSLEEEIQFHRPRSQWVAQTGAPIERKRDFLDNPWSKRRNQAKKWSQKCANCLS